MMITTTVPKVVMTPPPKKMTPNIIFIMVTGPARPR